MCGCESHFKAAIERLRHRVMGTPLPEWLVDSDIGTRSQLFPVAFGILYDMESWARDAPFRDSDPFPPYFRDELSDACEIFFLNAVLAERRSEVSDLWHIAGALSYVLGDYDGARYAIDHMTDTRKFGWNAIHLRGLLDYLVNGEPIPNCLSKLAGYFEGWVQDPESVRQCLLDRMGKGEHDGLIYLVGRAAVIRNFRS